jgi:hypothetical protein
VPRYLAFHLGAGHTHHRYRKAHGLRPNFYWSSVRGPVWQRAAAGRVPGRPSALVTPVNRCPAWNVYHIPSMSPQTGTHPPMTTPFSTVPPVPAEPADLREAAIALCDSCSDLDRNLANGLRLGLDLEDLRSAAVEKARAGLRLTELLADLFEGDQL